MKNILKLGGPYFLKEAVYFTSSEHLERFGWIKFSILDDLETILLMWEKMTLMMSTIRLGKNVQWHSSEVHCQENK